MFEGSTPYITVKPEMARRRGEEPAAIGGAEYAAKFGTKEFKIDVDQKSSMAAHIENFLHCMRSREKPHLDVETGARAQVVINLAVQSYREGRVMYWDEKNWKASAKPMHS